MIKHILIALSVLALLASCKQGGGGISAGDISSKQDSISYALGLSLATNTTKDGIKLDPVLLKKGYDETMDESTAMDQNSFQNVMNGFQTELRGRSGAPFSDTDKPTSNMDSVSYAIGYNVASSMKEVGLSYSGNLIAAGYADGIDGGENKFDAATTEAMMQALNQEQQAAYIKKQEIEGAKNKEEGDAYLAANKDKEGVVVLPSGLQYKVERAGSGASPEAESTVSVHYEGRLIDGTVFDSSYERGQPMEFPVGGVIRGWTEALKLMKPGAKWQLYIPGDLAYGLRGSPPKIGPNAVLVFDVELLEIK